MGTGLLTSWLAVAGTIALTVYGQIVIKWQLARADVMPSPTVGTVELLLRQLLNPWILSGFIAAFVAAMCWMLALTRLQLSVAYPFMALSFVLVLILSALVLDEPFTIQKAASVGVVVAGLALANVSW